METSNSELPAEVAELLELGSVLGQNQAFGLVAGRCSAAQAASLKRLRDERKYKRVTAQWRDFCSQWHLNTCPTTWMNSPFGSTAGGRKAAASSFSGSCNRQPAPLRRLTIL